MRSEFLKKNEDEWRMLIANYTGSCQKTSVNDLSFDQANALIERLGGRQVTEDHWGLFDKNDRQHKQILSLLFQLGWVTYHHIYGQVPDIRHLSNWLKSKRAPIHKPLMKMTTHELTKIISALDFMVLKAK